MLSIFSSSLILAFKDGLVQGKESSNCADLNECNSELDTEVVTIPDVGSLLWVNEHSMSEFKNGRTSLARLYQEGKDGRSGIRLTYCPGGFFQQLGEQPRIIANRDGTGSTLIGCTKEKGRDDPNHPDLQGLYLTGNFCERDFCNHRDFGALARRHCPVKCGTKFEPVDKDLFPSEGCSDKTAEECKSPCTFIQKDGTNKCLKMGRDEYLKSKGIRRSSGPNVESKGIRRSSGPYVVLILAFLF